jgi:hypothetical protein
VREPDTGIVHDTSLAGQVLDIHGGGTASCLNQDTPWLPRAWEA